MTSLRDKKLTIAIPCFNCEKNIFNIINNLCHKLSSKYIEILISDNNSFDNSYNKCLELKNKYSSFNIQIIRQKRNIGPGANFKYLLDKATSEFFLWIGSDDYITDLNENILLEFQKNKNLVGISFKSYFTSIKNDIVYDKSNYSIISNNKILRLIKFFNNPGVNSKFYSIFKTKLLKKSFNTNYCGKFGWDVVLTASLLKYGKIEFTDQVCLIRSYGISSDPLKLRRSLGFNGISLIFPPLKPFSMILNDLNFFEKIFLLPFLLKYYFRIFISPIHHLINK